MKSNNKIDPIYNEYLILSDIVWVFPYSKNTIRKKYFSEWLSIDTIVYNKLSKDTILNTKRWIKAILSNTRLWSEIVLKIPTSSKHYHTIYTREKRQWSVGNLLRWNNGEDMQENDIFNYWDKYYISQMNKKWEMSSNK